MLLLLKHSRTPIFQNNFLWLLLFVWKLFFRNYWDYCLKACYSEIIIEHKNKKFFITQLFMGTTLECLIDIPSIINFLIFFHTGHSYCNLPPPPLPQHINYWEKFPTQTNFLKRYIYADFFIISQKEWPACIKKNTWHLWSKWKNRCMCQHMLLQNHACTN